MTIPLLQKICTGKSTHQQINSPRADVLEEGDPLLEIFQYPHQDSDTRLIGILFEPSGMTNCGQTVLQIF